MGRKGNDSVVLTAMALGGISGLRTMAAPALLTQEVVDDGDASEFGQLEKVLTSEHTVRVLTALAGLEMIADKTDFVGDRTDVVPLVGRAVVGSLTAAAFAVRRRRPMLLPAAIGAVAAVASTFAAFHFRRYAKERFNIPDRLLGFAEDAIVVAATKLVIETVEV